MPDLDRNYLAGLYLDEITLDVMPQEYIDAALEVKLRRDACAPRAGFNCVQDRRVKGGFYYRKAPQGRGVTALPPSKLERALARSQEQSSAKSEMGFLGKAAIAAGLTVGGLALTGAVVNAGRSREPFQEPARPKTASAGTTFDPTSVGVIGAGTIAVGAAGLSLSKKPAPQDIESESISPTESAKAKPERNPEEEEGYRDQQLRNQALKSLSEAGYLTQKRAYEKALSKDLEKNGVSPENIEQKRKNLQFDDEHEGFVRIDDVKDSTADGVRLTKSAREQQSADLQRLYDKLKEQGVEDSIEFRGAVDKKFKNPLKPSANQYTLDLRDGNPPIQVGEMRFRKTQDQIQTKIAENIKNPQSRSQSPQKSAKPTNEKPEVTPPVIEEESLRVKKEQAQGTLADAIRRGAPSADGYVNQSSLLNDKVLKGRLADNDPAVLISEGIDEGRIQTKKVGKNTYVRDISAIPFDDLVAEAEKLKDVTDLKGDRRVKDLNDALDYKERKATSDEERAGAANLRAAIAGIQEVKAGDRVSNKKPPVAPKPDGENGEGGGRKVRGESSKMKAAADKAKEQKMPDVEPPIVARSEEQIAADRIAAEQSERLKKQEANQSKREGLAGTSGRAETRLADAVLDLERKKQKNEVEDKEFNTEVEKLRKNPVVIRAVTEAITPTQEEYQELVNNAKTVAEQESLRAKGTKIMEQQARDVYDRFKIPELIEIAPKVKEATTPPVTPPSSQASVPSSKPPTEKKKKPSTPKPKEEAPATPPTESERAVKGLQDSIAKTEATVQKLQDNIAKMKSGGNPSSAVIDLLNLSSKTLADLSPEGLISKMENAVTYHNGQVKEKQKELKVLSKKPKDEFAGTTVSTIKEMLKSQGISIPKGVTTKAELLKLLPNNDAIAPSEAYLQGYHEIRDKYRRK